MFRQLVLFAILGVTIVAAPSLALAENYPQELAPMVVPLEEVEAMMGNGTFSNGEFSLTVSKRDASTFAKTVKKKLHTAKSEYTRLPRSIRSSKEADKQWYRMDALIKTSKGFSKALNRHARALAEQGAHQAAAPNAAANAQPAPSHAPPVDQAAEKRADQARAEATDRKRVADARAAAVRAQQAEIRARAAAVKAEKQAAAKARAEGVEPTGPDWQNSYIPNIEELQSRDGFFQWPWSAPSWKAVTDKAALEQQKGALGSTQVAMFKDFVLDQADDWPAVPRTQDAGDAQYALDMIRKRESADGLDIVDLWISRGNWKIQRNALGAILSRTKPGYLLYKDPSGEGCILKQLWIKEPYAGGSSYEKTPSWRYAKLRFQSCDRR